MTSSRSKRKTLGSVPTSATVLIYASSLNNGGIASITNKRWIYYYFLWIFSRSIIYYPFMTIIITKANSSCHPRADRCHRELDSRDLQQLELACRAPLRPHAGPLAVRRAGRRPSCSSSPDFHECGAVTSREFCNSLLSFILLFLLLFTFWLFTNFSFAYFSIP